MARYTRTPEQTDAPARDAAGAAARRSCAIIHATGLTRTFEGDGRGQTVLDGLDVDIRRGDFTVIMGPSGAGKSTLLYALAGLERPTAGRVVFDGEDITAMRKARSHWPSPRRSGA